MTAILREDRNSNTTTAKKVAFSDFMCDFTPHPNTEDLVRLTDEAAVSRSIRNLVQTNKGERFFSDVGGNVRKMLFEPISNITADTIKTLIEDVINNHEPRAKLIDVVVASNEAYQSYKVDIYYYIINNPQPVGLSVTLYRVR
jgi:phage baseplate assembly protein W